jgi:glycosyltransferase involved in cell wall biosynthesis
MTTVGAALDFTVVVPTYRRPEALARCLTALARQDHPRERFEIIVADDGSGAPPRDVVSRFESELSITLVEAAHAGAGSARNTAAQRARGAYLAFTDDDCAPSPAWLSSFARRLAQDPHAAIGGRVENALAGNALSSASQLLVSFLYEYYSRHERAAMRFFTSNNLAMSTARFRELGGFDAVSMRTAAEDRELCDRWVQSGGTLLYEPEALVFHSHDLDFRAFSRQHFAYGRSAVHFHAARERRAGSRVSLEPLAFYLRLFDYPRRRGLGWRAPLQSALLTFSQVAYLSGYLLERARAARITPSAPRVP